MIPEFLILKTLENNTTPRRWVITEVRYNTDIEDFCTIGLENTKYYGSPFMAFEEAEKLFKEHSCYKAVKVVVIEIPFATRY